MTATQLPAYAAAAADEKNSDSFRDEKERPRISCPHGAASQTPHIDAQLQKPNARAALLALSAAFAAAAEDGDSRCLKCAIESVGPEVRVWMQDMKGAKKSGEFSKEEKKALKSELKGVWKGMKGKEGK